LNRKSVEIFNLAVFWSNHALSSFGEILHEWLVVKQCAKSRKLGALSLSLTRWEKIPISHAEYICSFFVFSLSVLFIETRVGGDSPALLQPAAFIFNRIKI
jgi:hypothetical protein